MTNEEARLTLQNNFGYLSQEHPRILEALKVAIETLSQPSLPSNLAEAAITQMEKDGDIDHFVRKGIYEIALKYARLGAEWMARQFQKIDGDLVDWYSTSDGKDYCCGVKTNDTFEVPEGFYIRKK